VIICVTCVFASLTLFESTTCQPISPKAFASRRVGSPIASSAGGRGRTGTSHFFFPTAWRRPRYSRVAVQRHSCCAEAARFCRQCNRLHSGAAHSRQYTEPRGAHRSGTLKRRNRERRRASRPSCQSDKPSTCLDAPSLPPRAERTRYGSSYHRTEGAHIRPGLGGRHLQPRRSVTAECAVARHSSGALIGAGAAPSRILILRSARRARLEGWAAQEMVKQPRLRHLPRRRPRGEGYFALFETRPPHPERAPFLAKGRRLLRPNRDAALRAAPQGEEGSASKGGPLLRGCDFPPWFDRTSSLRGALHPDQFELAQHGRALVRLSQHQGDSSRQLWQCP